MSDHSSKSKPARPSTPSKQEKATLPLKPLRPVSSLAAVPDETQIPERPPSGGQQPGEDLHKIPPPTSDM